MAGFKKATKARSKLRLALCGLAGSGKTWTMLSMASAMAKEMRRLGAGDGRIAVIDTEHESASLYADSFDFDSMALDDHSPRAYVSGIKLAESQGYDFCVIDSLTHAWTGKNGALEQKDGAAARGGNSWTAWRDITPMHNALVDAMLGCGMHLFASMRTKMDYVQNTDAKGKVTIEKVGLAAVQREGMEYEFTAVGDMELSNLHTMKISKIRGTSHKILIGDQFEHPGEELALRLYGWLMDGSDPAADSTQIQVEQPKSSLFVEINTAQSIDALKDLIPKITEAGRLDQSAAKDLSNRYTARKKQLLKMSEDASLLMEKEKRDIIAALSPDEVSK